MHPRPFITATAATIPPLTTVGPTLEALNARLQARQDSAATCGILHDKNGLSANVGCPSDQECVLDEGAHAAGCCRSDLLSKSLPCYVATFCKDHVSSQDASFAKLTTYCGQEAPYCMTINYGPDFTSLQCRTASEPRTMSAGLYYGEPTTAENLTISGATPTTTFQHYINMTEMSAAAQDRSKEESDHSLRTGVLVGLVVFAVGVAMAGVWVFALKKYRKYHEVAKKDDSEVVPEEKIVWRKDTPRPSLLKGFSP